MNPIFKKIPFLIALIGGALTPVLRAEVSDQHLPPAPLPEFKTPAQLAKWKADAAAKTAATEAKASYSTPGAFYTGKPYIAESGSYAFKYREYNPETARWTTVDPSGFPDGANNHAYRAVPTSEFDYQGLRTAPGIADYSTATISGATLVSYSLGSSPGASQGGEGSIIDLYTAVWSATVSMTFDNPFNTSTDSRTKTASGLAYASISGQLDSNSQFWLPSIAPGAALDVAPAELPNAIGQVAATGYSEALTERLSRISQSDLNAVFNNVNGNRPSDSSFSHNFPGSSWPTFTE